MTELANCQIVGRWRIVEVDLWDGCNLDLVEPDYLQIGADGSRELAFGAGSAELGDDGAPEIKMSFHNRDDAIIYALVSDFFGSLLVLAPNHFK